MPEPAVTPDDIAAALRRTRHHLRRTPVLPVDAGELGLPVCDPMRGGVEAIAQALMA